MSEPKFKHLLEPLKIGNYVLKNRMCVSNSLPHFLQGPETYPADTVMAHYENKAKSAAIVTCMGINNFSRGTRVPMEADFTHFPDFDLYDPASQNYLMQMVDAIHYHNSIACMGIFVGPPSGYPLEKEDGSVEEQAEKLRAALKDGLWVKARGNYRYDDYKREMVLMVSDVMSVPKPVREDNAPRKRVELHLHTQMSTMDACASAKALISQAAAWGHPAIAITDHGVVQAFPEAFGAVRGKDIKFIPGCEGYLIEDAPEIVSGGDGRALEDAAFVVLDFETTGLNPNMDEIIEIGAVRLEHGREVGEFSQLIDPGRAIPEKVVELTGINSAMLAGQPTLAEVFPKFAKFLEGAVLVAHNASFDMAFLRRAFQRFGKELDAPILDTLALARNAYKELRNHKLGTVCKHLDVSLKNAHRAVHDARATGLVLLKTLERLNVARLRPSRPTPARRPTTSSFWPKTRRA